MLLPYAENAVVDIGKLHDYCLNPNSEVGKHKAKVFASALGLYRRDAFVLRSAILAAVKTQVVVTGTDNRFGKRYRMDFAFEHADKTATIRCVWIIDAGSNIPRLITCYVL